MILLVIYRQIKYNEKISKVQKLHIGEGQPVMLTDMVNKTPKNKVMFAAPTYNCNIEPQPQ